MGLGETQGPFSKNNKMKKTELVSIREFAARAGRSQRTIKRWARMAGLRSVTRRTHNYPRADVDSFLAGTWEQPTIQMDKQHHRWKQ